MWKYIVTYFILIQTPCPPQLDEFGRKIPNNDDTKLVYREPCAVDSLFNTTRVFDSRDSAQAFMKRGIGEWNLKQFKLDSVTSVQYNCKHPSGTSTLMACPPNTPCNTFTCGVCGAKFATW